jgi:ABC-type antimicrobial peptide transport system permease subunit
MNMLKHYAIVAVRSLIRHKTFSAINIIGLALGMTCCLFIFLWVQDEKGVDNFHVNGKTLYSVYNSIYAGDQVSGSYAIPLVDGTLVGSQRLLQLASEIKQSIPEVQYAAFYATGYDLPWGHPETFQVGERIHKLEGSRAGQDFLNMLSYPVIAGDANTALKDISSLAISRKMAGLFFDNPGEAIGKSIRFENAKDFVVTAVFEDVPTQSSLTFDYLINWEAFAKGQAEPSSNYAQLIIQIGETADPSGTEAKLKHFLDTRISKNAGFKIELGLQPFGDHYLISNFVNGRPQGGRIEYVKIFSGVAIFILLMACINFMNLATARSVKRAKEVGVRKVVGSSRFHLIGQFFGESMLLSFFALVVSLALVYLLQPVFNGFTGKQVAPPITAPSYWLVLTGLMLFTGLVAGSYPALFLSSLKPVRILKGVVRFTRAAIWFRKGLAVFQFALSIILLIATLVVSRQTNYVEHTHLGYDRENLIYIRVEGTLNPKYAVFKEQASKMPGIEMVDRSSEAPHAMGFTVADAINWEGKEKDASVGFKPTSVGFDFIKLMNLKIVEGRDFSRAYATDSAAFMINEEAVKQMGLKDPIGKWVSAWDKKGHIIAVLKDYHTNSFHEPMNPLIMDVKEDLYFGVIMVRTEPGKTKEALTSLETVCKDINPNYPFVFQFLDVEYDKLYRNEQVTAKLSNVFALVAIIISCLGLLGLVMFSAEQRIKEIGIRKVLGATVTNIVSLLSKDFLALVAVSFVIAAPVAGYFMNAWLQGFAFKISLSWWIFALAGGGALLIALLTIGFQAIQSAIVNPVKSLRAE